MNLSLFSRAALLCLSSLSSFAADPPPISPSQMPRLGTVDERFQSFNIEMVEVTGGRFWAPYKAAKETPEAAPSSKLATPAIGPNAFRMRPPIDLSNARLRKLAAALGPSYMRVSGTWANSVYFQDSDAPALSTPPEGFGGVLTRQEWKAVVDFSHATNAKLITSFAITAGVRDANGIWTSAQAEKLLAFTKSVGGSIAAAEFFNEPTFAAMGGAPKGYDAATYGKDFHVFLPFLKKTSPETIVLGPGSVGEAAPMGPALSLVKSEDMLTASGRGVDAFSYHFYGGVSRRCGSMPGAPSSSPETALSDEWFSRTDRDEAYYAALRDRFEPGKPIWLTETGETACGGDPWAASFIDSFRYLEQLGRLAKKGVQVVAHNTLAASDYALIDEDTLTPRPNYWSALLWHTLMGSTVLDAGTLTSSAVHLYAQCLPHHPGGVTLLAINTDREAAHPLTATTKSERYTLTAPDLLGSQVQLNGSELALGKNDALPKLKGVKTAAGEITLPAASITFLAFTNAANASCQ